MLRYYNLTIFILYIAVIEGNSVSCKNHNCPTGCAKTCLDYKNSYHDLTKSCGVSYIHFYFINVLVQRFIENQKRKIEVPNFTSNVIIQ